MNTVDSVCILEISKTETHLWANTKDIDTLSNAELLAEVCKWSVEHVEDNGNEADDTKIVLTAYVKYGN